jgi:sugar phosphate isomerase/epimerase
MNFGISTQIFRRRTITVDVLETIRKAGYQHIELFCARPHLDFHSKTLLRAIGRWFQENALPAPSIHLPFLENTGPTQKIWLSALHPERRFRESAIDEIKRSLDLAEYVTPAYVVLHLGNPGEKFTPMAFDYAYAAISQIRAYAPVDVMIENIPNEISTVERICELKAVAQVAHIGICYDTGHGHLQGTISGFEHIQTTHIHDNHGEKDEHLWPFEGTLDWPALIEKLILANYNGLFLFEARGDDLAKGDEVRRRFEDLWHEAQDSLEEFRLKWHLL